MLNPSIALSFFVVLILEVILLIILINTGRLLFYVSRHTFEGVGEEVAFSFGLGAGLFAFLIWIFGVIGLASSQAAWGVAALFFVTLFYPKLSIFKFLKSLFLPFKKAWQKPEFFNRFFLTLSIISIASAFLASGSPAVGHDAQAYHVYCPSVWASEGKIGPISYNPNALQPFLVQMFFLFGLLVKNIAIGKIIGPASFLFLGIAAASFARRFSGFSDAAPAIVATLVYLTPGLAAQAPYAYVDVPLSFFVFLSFYAMFQFFTVDKYRFLIISGLFAGLAMGTKILALQSLLALFCVFILWVFLLKRSRVFFRALMIWGALALVVGGIWYLRSWIVRGNPVFPYFNHFFTGKPWFSDVADSIGIGRDFLAFVSAPFLLFLAPDYFGGGDNRLGLVYFFSLPLVILLPRSTGKTILSVFVSASFIIWFFLVQNQRFIFPAVAGMALLSTEGFLYFKQRLPRFQSAIKILFLILLASQLILIFYYNGKLSRYLVSSSSESFLAKTERAYEISNWAKTSLPANSRVVTVNEPCLYYLGPSSTRWEMIQRFEGNLPESATDPEAIRFLKKEGYTHLLVRFFAGEDFDGNFAQFKKIKEELFEDRFIYRLYAL